MKKILIAIVITASCVNADSNEDYELIVKGIISNSNKVKSIADKQTEISSTIVSLQKAVKDIKIAISRGSAKQSDKSKNSVLDSQLRKLLEDNIREQ